MKLPKAINEMNFIVEVTIIMSGVRIKASPNKLASSWLEEGHDLHIYNQTFRLYVLQLTVIDVVVNFHLG